MRPLLLVFALAFVGCVGRADGEGEGESAEGEGEGEGENEAAVEGACVVDVDNAPDFLAEVACTADFQALASTPIDETLPGARSVKVVLDRADNNALYFQNSVRFQIHHDFVSTHLSGNGLPVVPDLETFNTTEYFSPERRFVLGAVTFYEAIGAWALELSPYDTASADLIEVLFNTVSDAAFFGPALRFHPTSSALETVAAQLSDDVETVTTNELYNGIDYQPLSLGTAIGRLRFQTADEIDAGLYLSYEDIVVLDQAPNDISVVQGLITEEFQTPLSHINVLSQNRRTPNMGLRGAMTNAELRALEGQLVELSVTSSSYTVRAATIEEAEAFWIAHAPAAVTLPVNDVSVTELVPLDEVTAEPGDGETLRDRIKTAVLAFCGKAAHYSVLLRTADVPIKNGFAIPVYYYDKFMRDNGFYDRATDLGEDPDFRADPAVRDAALAEMRNDMMIGRIDADFQVALQAKLAAEFPTGKVRFRTSTNSEDLEGFPCAGCYESHSGDVTDFDDVLDAIRETWSSAWLFRTYEERTYYGVDHNTVGMALMVHENFPDEEANGVAITSNIFDDSGLDPAFTVNVQFGGDAEVVHPPAGVSSDLLLLYFTQPNQPTTYISHSSLIAAGSTVLTNSQLHELGVALEAIHERFSPAYGPASGNTGFYAMDVEFKFDDDDAPTETPHLFIKQARPYPGRSE